MFSFLFTGVTSSSDVDCIEDPSATGSSVAKVVQPTATVSSVPVCGPSKYLKIRLLSTKLNYELFSIEIIYCLKQMRFSY